MKTKPSTCVTCGNTLPDNAIGRKRHYCNDACKQAAYRNRRSPTGSMLRQYEVLERDNFQCFYCGRSPAQDRVKLQIDHVIPTSKGGKSVAGNVVAACSECNVAKSNSLPHRLSELVDIIRQRNQERGYHDQRRVLCHNSERESTGLHALGLAG